MSGISQIFHHVLFVFAALQKQKNILKTITFTSSQKAIYWSAEASSRANNKIQSKKLDQISAQKACCVINTDQNKLREKTHRRPQTSLQWHYKVSIYQHKWHELAHIKLLLTILYKHYTICWAFLLYGSTVWLHCPVPLPGPIAWLCHPALLPDCTIKAGLSIQELFLISCGWALKLLFCECPGLDIA